MKKRYCSRKKLASVELARYVDVVSTRITDNEKDSIAELADAFSVVPTRLYGVLLLYARENIQAINAFLDAKDQAVADYVNAVEIEHDYSARNPLQHALPTPGGVSAE